ncbi:MULTISPECIES: hypothetical protein [unclassified Spiroplasma]|uniref:hypothetical protein n=1 Tax=unclassified Spiroplasma TaxID=2637901 RepID=UPI00313E2A22
MFKLGSIFNLVLPMDSKDNKKHPHILICYINNNSFCLLSKIVSYKKIKTVAAFNCIPIFKKDFPCLKNDSMLSGNTLIKLEFDKNSLNNYILKCSLNFNCKYCPFKSHLILDMEHKAFKKHVTNCFKNVKENKNFRYKTFLLEDLKHYN